MKFKLDENLPVQLASILHAKGDHLVDTVKDENLRGATDHVLARKCKVEERILITLDVDFLKSHLHPLKGIYGIVVLRSDFPSMRNIMTLFTRFLEKYKVEEIPGKIIIVEKERLVIRDE
jgi:predicted nuclease of predicted toxin-antitoxin system